MHARRQIANANHLDLEFRWTPVLSAAGQPYRFPQKTTKYLRAAYDGPGVYCWRIERPGMVSVLYLGETVCVQHRLTSFLGPALDTKTNMRLNTFLTVMRGEGAEITFEVLSFPAFEINGYEVSMERLGNPHVRRLVENMAILTEARMGSIVLNRGRELLDRQKERMFEVIQGMKRADRNRFLKFLGKQAGKV